jgi:predicted nucleic acid-binding protein
MMLESIKSGVKVFIDANIFIYHFTGVSGSCTDFLGRCEQGEINGITSANVLLEVLHRLMMIEAVKKGLIEPPNLVNKLKKHPEKIKKLNEYFINTQKITEMGILVLPVSPEIIFKSHFFRIRYGMMVNDSLIAASLQEQSIKLLVTNDDQFNKIDGLTVFSPGDVSL